MSGVLGGSQPRFQVTRYAGMQVTTSLQGQVIPYVAGRNRIPMNLLWYGNFKSIPGKSAGGKGGGGAASSYTYTAAWIGALSLGQIKGIYTVWLDKSQVALTTQGLAWSEGGSAPPVWSGYPSGTPADQQIPYDHIAYVAASNYNFGDSPSMPDLTFEVEGIVGGYNNGAGMFDADPSAVVVSYLTDPVVGAGFQGEIETLTGLTNSFQAYCMSAGINVSPYENNQRTATDFMTELMQITNSDLVLSCGTLKVIPYADAPISGTTPDGTHWSYTPDLTPVYSFGDDDFMPKEGQEPVQVDRKPLDQTYNIVNLTFYDRANLYNQSPASASDSADIALNGPRAMSTLTFQQVTTASVAKTVAQLILQFQLYERNTYTFRVRADYALLEPMDYVAVTDSGLGITNQVVRITEIEDDGDNCITIKAMEVPGTVRNTPQYAWGSAQGYTANYDEAPGSVSAPTIFQMPPIPGAVGNGQAIGVAVGPPTDAAFWGGCDVNVSLDGGTTYDWVGTIGPNGTPRYGTITAALGAVADPDTTSTLSVLLQNTTQQIETTVTDAEADSNQTLLLVGTGATAEVMSFGSATLESAGAYNLSYLRRNLYGSVNQTHASGAPFARLDGSIFQLPIDAGMAGQTIYFKFTSFNSVGRAYEDISTVTAYPFVVPAAVANGNNLDNVSDGSTYAKTLSSYLASGKPYNFRGAYSATVLYTTGDEVTYTGNYYLCVGLPAAGTAPTNTAYWQLLGPATLDNLPNGAGRFAQGSMENMLATTSWAIGSSGNQGNYVDDGASGQIYLAGSPSTIPMGPYGVPEPVWLGYGGVNGDNVGWTNTADLAGLDPTKTYRSCVWAYLEAGAAPNTGTIYFGCSPTYTNNLNGTANTAPYFWQGAASTLTKGRWYLLVGMLHGSGYAGSSSGQSGVYDPESGQQIAAGTDFICAAGAPGQQHNVHLYFDTDAFWIMFARPRFEIVDGTEPSIASMLASSLDGMPDGSTYLRMPTPASVSAAGVTGLTQSGTTTTINVSASTYYLGNLTLSANAGSVNPGAYGTYYVYFDDPNYVSGPVTYQATTNQLVLTQNPYRFYVGTITTVSGGGAGGGTGGGGGSPCFSGDTCVMTPDGPRRFDELPELFEVVNRTGRHRAQLIVHRDSLEPVRRMGCKGLVTDSHLMQVGDAWLPAAELFYERAPVAPRDLYNMHVLSDRAEDWHYVLENGLTAHNLKMQP